MIFRVQFQFVKKGQIILYLVHSVSLFSFSISLRSVADLGCSSRIPDPIFSIPNPGSRVDRIPDPGSESASNNLSIFKPKKLILSFKK
jgi:hypothetical protein